MTLFHFGILNIVALAIFAILVWRIDSVRRKILGLSGLSIVMLTLNIFGSFMIKKSFEDLKYFLIFYGIVLGINIFRYISKYGCTLKSE